MQTLIVIHADTEFIWIRLVYEFLYWVFSRYRGDYAAEEEAIWAFYKVKKQDIF